MVPGQAITIPVRRQSPGGLPAPGRAAADFVLACAGALVPFTLTELGTAVGSAWTDYALAIVLPTTLGQYIYSVEAAVPADVGGDTILDGQMFIDLQSADDGSIMAALLTQQGVPTVTSAADAALGDVVDQDTYLSPIMTAPAAGLAQIGVTDLTASGLVVEAAIRAAPGTTSYPITITALGGLTFQFGWPGGTGQPFPVLTTTQGAPWYIDCQVIKAGSPVQIKTFGRFSFNQAWQRDPRTS